MYETTENNFLIPPMTGDLIFCTGNPLIEAAQALPAFSTKNITHVAIMVSSTEIAEAMIKKSVGVVSFKNWAEERHKNNPNETNVVLRTSVCAEKPLVIQRRIAYYLEEPYRIEDIFDWTKAGTSICTSFVAKVLSTAGIVAEPSARKGLLPGSLFKYLQGKDFYEVDTRAFFAGSELNGAHEFFESTVQLLDILDNLTPALAEFQAKMMGWTSVVERDMKSNPFSSLGKWRQIAQGDVVPFGMEVIETCKSLLKCIQMLEQRGPRNWNDDFSKHEEKIETMRQGAAELFDVVTNLSEHLSKSKLIEAVGRRPTELSDKIYENVNLYIRGVQMATASMRAILEMT